MEERDSNDMTPFMVSIICNHKEVIRLFIECGCEIYSHGKLGKTVLDWAIEKSSTGLLEVSNMICSVVMWKLNVLHTQVLIELHDTKNQSAISLCDKDENTLVHATAKYHKADCLSVRL